MAKHRLTLHKFNKTHYVQFVTKNKPKPHIKIT